MQYLSNADERLKWQANSLPSDDLCTENAIMIKRFNRYPLVIDPSGQATEFIMNEYRDRKITRTRCVLRVSVLWGVYVWGAFALCVCVCARTYVHVTICMCVCVGGWSVLCECTCICTGMRACES